LTLSFLKRMLWRRQRSEMAEALPDETDKS
jgi:hypothetical protein